MGKQNNGTTKQKQVKYSNNYEQIEHGSRKDTHTVIHVHKIHMTGLRVR